MFRPSSVDIMAALLIAALLVTAVAPPAEAAITCSTVINILKQYCIPYVLNRGPLGGCCGEVRRLYNAAKTTTDRQAVCNCLKPLAGSCTNLGKAAGLPKQCGLNIPYKISPSTVCRNVR